MSYKDQIKKFVPKVVYQPVVNILRKPKPVYWGNLRKLSPVSRVFGFDRGLPIDRFYIEDFLRNYQEDIKGIAFEIGEPLYINKFGGNRVTKIDVLHAVEGNPSATIIGDLASGSGIPHNTYDCMIVTQTLHLIYEIQQAVANIYQALKPGGVLLATLPSISQISRYDMDRWGDCWRFTDLSARKLFAGFDQEQLKIVTYGNVLAAMAFLQGLAVQDLKTEELLYYDPDYPVTIAVRAVKLK